MLGETLGKKKQGHKKKKKISKEELDDEEMVLVSWKFKLFFNKNTNARKWKKAIKRRLN